MRISAWSSDVCSSDLVKPCAASNPGAAAAKPCNPCAVKKKPCAAAANPCAAQKPCAAASPCAAKAPCGAKNPCAAKNPCGAKNPCNPCNPCGAAVVPDVTLAELRAVYDCLQGYMRPAYGANWQTGTPFANYSTVRARTSEEKGKRVEGMVDAVG